jgi:nucleoside-diphosphate-sugar epimerase
MSQMNIIVSGASGNLGSAIIDFFLSRGDKVIGLVHRHHEYPLVQC